MDSTFITIDNFPLTTLLGVDFGGFGVPLAFMISTNEDWGSYATLLTEVFTQDFIIPDAIVVDKSDAEIKAIKEFPLPTSESRRPISIVCYFHVLQAVKRYMRSNSVVEEVSKVVLAMLKAIQQAQTSERFNMLVGKLERYLMSKGTF